MLTHLTDSYCMSTYHVVDGIQPTSLASKGGKAVMLTDSGIA